MSLRFSIGLVGYIVATLLAFFSAAAALILCGLIAVYYLFDHLPDPADVAGPPAETASGGS